MALDAVSQLGGSLAAFQTRQQTTANNISPNDTTGFLRIYEENAGGIIASGSVTLNKWEYESDAFILDNDPQGELDSAVYKLDEGYTVASPTLIETKVL
jgi:hypothetical protein